MATLSKSGSSRRKGDSPGKIKILMNGGSGKVVHSDSENDGDETMLEDLPEGTVIVEPQPIEESSSKKKKEIPGRIDSSVLDNVNCTACGRQLNPYKNGALQKHPQLKVVICKKCEKFLTSGEIAKDKDGIDEQCRWCGEGGRLVVCDDCSSAFCKACVMRNFNRSEFNNINDQDSWKCYLCDKSQLHSMRENYRKIRDTLKSLQAKQKAKEERMNGAKDKMSPGSSRSAPSNGRKTVEAGSSSEVQHLKSSGPELMDSDIIVDSDIALTVQDLAVDYNQVDVIMDKLSTSTNTFKEMLRALRSQFHSTSPRAADEAPPMFQFSLRPSMDVNRKKQKCAKALEMGLTKYLQSLKAILHNVHNDSDKQPAQGVQKSQSVVVDPVKTENISDSKAKPTLASKQSLRIQTKEKGKAEKAIEKVLTEKPKPENKSGSAISPKSPVASRNLGSKGEKDKSSVPSSKVKPTSKTDESDVSQNKSSSGKQKGESKALSDKDKNVSGASHVDNSLCSLNIDDEENVAARLDLIQELAEEMLKDNVSEDEQNISEKEDLSEGEENNEVTSGCDSPEKEIEGIESEKGKRKRGEDKKDETVTKKRKRESESNLNADSEKAEQDGNKEKDSDSSDNEDKESKNDEENSKANAQADSSSSDPLSSDEEQTAVSRSKKRKKKQNSSQDEDSTKTQAKKNPMGKAGVKPQLSRKTSLRPKSKEKKDQEEKDSLDKEIDRFSKLPTMQKRKKPTDNEEDDADSTEKEKRMKKEQKSKPGPKSSKKGIDLEDLSSESEDKAGDDGDDSNEDDDLEPKVTFFLEADNGNDQDMTEDTENELAKKRLLEENEEEEKSDEDENESSDSSELSDDEEESSKTSKTKGRKDAKKKDDEDKDSSDKKSSEEENDSEEDIGKKSKRIRSKLLDTKLTDSGSDEDEKPDSKKGKKNDKDYTEDKDNSSSGSSLESDSSDKDEDSDEDEEEEEEEEEEGKKSKKKGKKGKKGKRKGKKKDAGDDDEEEEGKKGKGKKRKRIKKMSHSSDEDEEKEEKSDDEDEANSSKAGKRKKIRKVMSNKKLEDSTRAAAKAEEKRRKRIAAKQREFNVETITDENNPMNCPITTKLILEPGKEEGDDPIVQVNKKLIRKLKPHQVEAVQFLWDCMFESVKRSKKESGAGCILAHCMGLGKTLSVISFIHTILAHEKALKMRTCLVVCPLNTVLNWRNEWTMWLDKKDQPEVWELASCKQNAARSDVLKEWHESGGIMIMGYEMYRNLTMSARIKNKRQKKVFQQTLVDPGPDLVVCDEGHILKNETSAVSKAMNQMVTRRRVVLTGTPLQNNLNEYHCMVNFVKPNLLGTRKEFNNRFISPIQNGQCTDSTPRDVKIMKARAHVLHEMLAGCVQRRDYSALTKFLPPKQEYVISVRMTDVQVELYEKYLELTGQGVDGIFTNKGARLFKDYQNLMKIWTHPWVLKLAEIRDEMKMKFDDEDSFIDDESEEERSFSSSESDSDDDKKANSDSGGEGMSLGPNSKRGTRRTRAKARRQAGEDSDPEEVIAEWKSKSRQVEEEAAKPPSEVDKTISNEWWAQYVSEDDKQKMELGNKLFLLFEILRMCEEIGDKVLIFSQSILSLNIIEDFLETVDSSFQTEMDNKPETEETNEEETFGRSWTKNLDYYRMDGSTSAQNRQMWAQAFNDVDNYRARLFLISTKAGGLGINLVAANRVIIFDASWNPSHDVQSIFRVYRFGQIKPCYIYRFLAQGTMEEKIYERQVTKLSLSQRVVDEHQIERHFSANDLKELYNFRPDRWDDEAEPPTLALPKDPLLAEILKTRRKCVVSFHEHDSLLENQVEQTLTEEEKKAAWEEYENEKKGIIVRGPGMDSMNRTASWPMMAAAQILSREQITATVQALRQQLPDLPEEMFHLHVQQALRRQVQMKQEEMRRMELMRMQEMTYLNMMSEAERSGMTHGLHSMQNLQNLAPWMQMQRLRAMQNHYMQQNLGGAYGMAGMSTPMGTNPEEPIDLDESPSK